MCVSLQVDQSPEGQAQRLRQEQAKARRRAKKLGILVDSYGDFEVDAGTSAGNIVELGQEGEEPDGGRGREEEEAAKAEAKARENRLEEEEKKVREELKNKKLYGQDMAAIAMGHPEVAQGPGKLTSMGSSSYVVDRVRRTENEMKRAAFPFPLVKLAKIYVP